MMNKAIRNILLTCLAILGLFTSVSAQEYFGGNHLCEPYYPEYGRFSIGADWLYWKASEDGLNYSTFKNTATTIPGTTLTANSNSIQRPDFLWESGYKVYAGYELPCYEWEIDIIYTHAPHYIATSALIANSAPIATPPVQNILLLPTFLFTSPIAGAVSTTVVGSTIAAEWKLDFDYIDFDLGHTLCLSDYLSLSPHIGVRYLWMKQRFEIAYTGTDSGSAFVYATQMQERAWGTGIEGGLWTNWQVGSNFSIIGHLGGSILYGNYKLNSGLAVKSTRAGVITNVAEALSERICTSIPMVDYFIGVQYGLCLGDIEFNFNIGWEQHVVFNANRFTLSDTGDLSLQGLTLGGGFNF